MGIILGLFGAGGSILSVPILVYIFEIEPIKATSYSLYIVLFASMFGIIRYLASKDFCMKSLMIFLPFSSLGSYLSRNIALHNMPEIIFTLPKDDFVMYLFALTMIIAGIFTIYLKASESKEKPFFFKSMISLSIGAYIGVIGIGGGFLIIPTLISFFKLDSKKAAGTSLTAIIINSIILTILDISNGISTDYSILLKFIFLSSFGAILGSFLTKKINSENLKNYFGFFVIILGSVIIFTKIIF
jgi:uncharacterized protein